MPDTDENRQKLIRFVGQEVSKDKKIPHFNKGAVAEIIREAQRRSGRRGMLTLRLRELGGLVRVAGDIATEKGAAVVDAQHVMDAKKIAREMMKMSGEVNSILAKSIGSMRPDPLQVRCVTCHHGLVKPETLEQVLTASLNLAGTDSTLAKYERLRGKYYGAAAYDFSEWSLISIAENIAKDPGKADAALALLATNLTYYPESAGTYARIAETYLVKGDRETAIANFDKALALAPEDPWLKRRVEKVKAGN